MFPFIITVLVLLLTVAAIGAVFNVALRLRTGERLIFPMRLLFRIYLYLITLASLLTLVTGLSDLVQAGLGAGLGKEFSYDPVYIYEPRTEPIAKDGTELEEPPSVSEKGLDRAMKEGLLDGISLTIVGALVLALHTWGRLRLEIPEERQDVLHRIYLILMLVLFGGVTLVTLPSAVFETLRFYILDSDQYNRTRPGGSLATALITLPVWGYYLRTTIGMLRRQESS